jgi:uncharacterized MAPEG superfamily protein
MTTDLTLLVWTAVFATVLPFAYVASLLTVNGGFAWGLGNRERPLATRPAWADRAQRAHDNLVENFVPFAALVLVAHASGHANASTALGAQLFFYARLVYTALYIAGVTPWRTLAYAVGQTGLLLIALQLL